MEEHKDLTVAMQKSHSISVTEVNPFLVCGLCEGYLIDATTLVDCLHSFCRSCLLKYFFSKPERHCPVCNNGPLKKLTGLEFMRQDRHLQSIVYKLVPKLFKDEMKRRKDFYETHALDSSKEMLIDPVSPDKGNNSECAEQTKPQETEAPHLDGRGGSPPDEMFSISLQFVDGSSSAVANNTPSTPLLQSSSSASTSPSTTSASTTAASTSADPSPNTTSASDVTNDSFINALSPLTFHLLCPASATVGMLQKFVRLKFDLNSTSSSSGNRFDVHLFCGDFFDEALPSSYTLHDVACISLWRRLAPLELAYSIFVYPQDHGGPKPGSENGLTNGYATGHQNAKQRMVNGIA